MAGQPVRRELLARIAKMGSWEQVVFGPFESGATIASIAESLGVSRSFLSHLLNDDPERRERLEVAKREKASALVEEAGKIVDTAEKTRDGIQHAKERAAYRLWLAARLDRRQYGEETERSTIEIKLGELHLQALMKPAVRGAAEIAARDAQRALPKPKSEKDSEPDE